MRAAYADSKKMLNTMAIGAVLVLLIVLDVVVLSCLKFARMNFVE